MNNKTIEALEKKIALIQEKIEELKEESDEKYFDLSRLRTLEINLSSNRYQVFTEDSTIDAGFTNRHFLALTHGDFKDDRMCFYLDNLECDWEMIDKGDYYFLIPTKKE